MSQNTNNYSIKTNSNPSKPITNEVGAQYGADKFLALPQHPRDKEMKLDKPGLPVYGTLSSICISGRSLYLQGGIRPCYHAYSAYTRARLRVCVSAHAI